MQKNYYSCLTAIRSESGSDATMYFMGRAGGNQIAPSKESVKKTIERLGENRIVKLCEKLEIEDGLESMTNRQVNYTRSFNSSKLDGIIQG